MTNLELMTTSAARLAELGRPCLPHLDTLIVNDFEIGALAGARDAPFRRFDRRRRGPPRDRRRARSSAPCAGSSRIFPKAPSRGGRDGTRVAIGSVAIPAARVAGANGAGDAFAAGMIYGLHEDWPIAECLRPRARVRRRLDARRLDDRGRRVGCRVLALAEKWGLRPFDA